VSKVETCARCGHQSGGCPRCGQDDPFLGAMIGDEHLCHTFVKVRPTCYTLACWDGASGEYQSTIEFLEPDEL